MRVLGAILAGGRSSRFGTDKAAALLEGRPLVEHVRAALMAQTGAVVLVGRSGGIPDRPAADMGPLAGLNAALHHGRAHGFDLVLSVPCDAPRLPADLVQQLGMAPAHVADLPVVGLWPCAAADALDRHLAEGGSRSVRRFATAIGARAVTLDMPIANVNTLADLARLAGGGP